MLQVVISMLQLLMIGVAFTLCFYLFVTLKRELYVGENRRQLDTDVARRRINELEHQLALVRKELELAQQTVAIPTAVPALVAPSAPTGLSQSKRNQALKMVKSGEASDRIASALSLPRKEVELLVKVQRMIVDTCPSTA